jgi:hypothetical protein
LGNALCLRNISEKRKLAAMQGQSYRLKEAAARIAMTGDSS